MMMVGAVYLVLGMFMSVFFKVNGARRPRLHRIARLFMAVGVFEIAIYSGAFVFFSEPGERSFYQTLWGSPVIVLAMLYFIWLLHKELKWYDSNKEKEARDQN